MTRVVRQMAAEDKRPFVPIFSSSLGVGGVEAVADNVHQTLVAAGYPSALYAGERQIAFSGRPRTPGSR